MVYIINVMKNNMVMNSYGNFSKTEISLKSKNWHQFHCLDAFALPVFLYIKHILFDSIKYECILNTSKPFSGFGILNIWVFS